MIELLFAVPVFFTAVLLVFRNKTLNRVLLAAYSAFYLAAVVLLYAGVHVEFLPQTILRYFRFDAAGALFLLILAVVQFCAALYSFEYLAEHDYDPKWDTFYAVFFMLFLTAMTGVILSAHLALLWVFVEATTLTGTLLIYFERRTSCLEAAWKYLFICTIGVSFAFIGIILLSIGGQGAESLFFDDLYKNAASFNPFWLKIAFAFILVGLGTKMGLAPVHAWLPDAHSEAPSPISALLSGTLLNAAFLGIVRVYKILLLAGLDGFTKLFFLIMGFLSLLVCAAFVMKTRNYKRMLAYSSIENMGLVAIGFGLGGAGIFAAFLQMTVHSFGKALFFFTSGNVHSLYRTKEAGEVSGMIRADKFTGWVWIFAFLALSGVPPFPAFLSKFLLLQTAAGLGQYLVLAAALVLLLVILYNMGKTVLSMSFGTAPVLPQDSHRPGFLAKAPEALLIVILLGFGIAMPAFVRDLVRGAADFLKI